MPQFFRTKPLVILLLSLLVAWIAAGCGASGATSAAEAPKSVSAPTTITVQGADGPLELQGVPKRIVTMEFSFTDALVSLDVIPVGVADDSDPKLFMDAVKSKLGAYTSVGSRYEPNMELISSLAPDLIIADLNKHKAVLDKFRSIAPTLVLDDYQADYEHMLGNVATIAKAVGKEAEGKIKLEAHKAKVEEVKKKLNPAGLSALPAVVNPKGFYAHSDHAYTGSFITMLGFKNPVSDTAPYPQLSLEQLVETNPQALFLMPTAAETIIKQWEMNPLWQKLDAVKSSRVFTVERRDWALARGLIGADKMLDDIVKHLGK